MSKATVIAQDLSAVPGATPERIATFWSLVDRSSGGDTCWQWSGIIAGQGYGYFQIAPGLRPRRWRAHRLAYVLLVGPIPEGLVLDHQCNNRLCVNPAHLNPTTNRENVLRGAGNAVAWRTGVCKRGHAIDGVAANKPRCKTCHRLRQAAYYAASKVSKATGGVS